MAENKKKNKKVKIWVALAIVALVAIIILAVVLVGKLSEILKGIGTPVEVTEVVRGSIAQTVDTSGTVESEEIKTYFADVTAPVDTVSVKPGQSVKKGDVLLSYNTQELEKMIKQTELETKISTYGAEAVIVGINHSQQKAAQAAANYEDAKKYVAHYTECVGQLSAQIEEATELSAEQTTLAVEIENLTKALAKNPKDKASAKALKQAEKDLKAVTKKLEKYDMKALKAALETCSGDLAEYKALLKEYELTKESDPTAALNKAQQSAVKESAQMAKDSAQEQLATANRGVRAEFDGIVSEVAAVEGQTAAEGVQLFTIHNANAIKVALSVTKYDMQKLAVGQTATIEINEKEYTGSVSAISRIASMNASGATIVNVDVHVDNPDDNVILGMEAKVCVQTAEMSDILIIPSASVNYSSDGIFCYVLADGVIEKKEIETGISDDEYIQVVSGLSEGDKVVTNVTGTIEVGMQATEMKTTAPEEEANEEQE